MKNILNKIGFYIRKVRLFLLLIAGAIASAGILRILLAERVQKVESPIPFVKDKKDKRLIYVETDKGTSTITIPYPYENKDVKAVQVNKTRGTVEVEVKHEKIDMSKYTDSTYLGEHTMDL